MFTYVLYGLAAVGLAASFFKSKAKTKAALKKAWKSFENILPQLLAIMLLVGIMLSILNEDTISKLIGADSGLFGMAIAAAVGSITLIPGFVAFPLAASLLEAGAGYYQITAFISTLMMVGVVTLPVERGYFGKKAALLRNIFALIYSVAISFVIGGIVA